MRARKRSHALGLLLCLPACILLFLFILWPIATAGRYSVSGASGFGDMEFVGLDNFSRALADEAFHAAISRNVGFALVVVAASVLLGFVLAYMLFLRVRGWRLLQILLLVPYILPLIVTALVWRFMMEPQAGLINESLRAVGLGALTSAWLTGPETAFVSASIVQIWTTIPFAMLLIFASLLSLPSEALEAAELDGAGHLRTMFQIVLPMIRPTVILTASIIAIQLFRSFDLIWLLTKGGPIGSTTIATLYVFVQGFVNNEYGYANAVGLILGIIVGGAALLPRLIARQRQRATRAEI